MKIELYHDTLAQKVFQMASTEEQIRLKMEDFIRSRFAYYQQRGVLLGKEDLEYIGPYWKDSLLEEEEKAFVKKSITGLQQKQRRARRTTTVVVASLALLLVFALYQLAVAKASGLQQQRMSLALRSADALYDGDPSLAFRFAEASAKMGIDEKSGQILRPIIQEIDHSPIKCDLVHVDSVTAFDISDSLIAAGSQSGVLKIWNIDCLPVPLEIVHPSRINVVRFGGFGQVLLSGSEDGTVFFVNLGNGAIDTLNVDAPVRFISVTPEQPFFLVGNARGRVQVFWMDGLEEISHLSLKLSPPLIAAEFSSNADHFLLANEQTLVIKPFQPSSEAVAGSTRKFSEKLKLARFLPAYYSDRASKILVNFEDGAALLDEQGKDLGARSDYRYLLLSRDLQRLKRLQLVRFGRNPIDSARMLLVSGDSTVLQWTLANGKRFTISSKAQPVFASYSTESYILLSLSNQLTDLWQAKSGKLVAELKCKSSTSKFAQRENIFITSDYSEVIHLWDLHKEKLSVSEHQLLQAGLERYSKKLRDFRPWEKELIDD